MDLPTDLKKITSQAQLNRAPKRLIKRFAFDINKSNRGFKRINFLDVENKYSGDRQNRVSHEE